MLTKLFDIVLAVLANEPHLFIALFKPILTHFNINTDNIDNDKFDELIDKLKDDPEFIKLINQLKCDCVNHH